MAPVRISSSGRMKSPILAASGEIIGNGPEKQKIYRIALTREAHCEVTSVESPSHFWIRLPNHITESAYLKPRKLESVKYVVDSLRFKYVFAPRQPNTYRRARVVRTERVNDETMALVHFIDFGDRDWVSVKALAHMDNEYFFHPWQAIACCLFAVAPKVTPGRSFDSNKQPMWTEDEATVFRQLVANYTEIKVEVKHVSTTSNDSRETIKVNLLGKEKKSAEEDESGTIELESIGQTFVRRCLKTVTSDRKMLDAHQQYQYQVPEPITEMNPPDPTTLDSWKLALGTNVDDAVVYPNRSQLQLWSNEHNPDAKGTQIPLVTMTWLQQNGYINSGSLLMHVEGACTVSPYEFYARPLKDTFVQLDDVDCDDQRMLKQADAIIEANLELQQFVDTLNTFYGEPDHRQIVDQTAVLHALNNGDRAYGMVERTDDAAQFTGSWQRVELIAPQYSQDGVQVLQAQGRLAQTSMRQLSEQAQGSILVRVRYLDAGGSDIKELGSVFEIHPDHASRPPFCIQFSLFGLVPRQQQSGFNQSGRGGFESVVDRQQPVRKWSSEAKGAFKTLLREDVPLSANCLLGRLNILQDHERIDYLGEPCLRPNVIFVNNVVVRAENSSNSESIDDQLIRQGHAVRASDDSAAPVLFLDLIENGVDVTV